MALAGVLVLAGGAGSRMGGDKPQRPFLGVTLAERCIGRVQSAAPWLRVVTAPGESTPGVAAIPDVEAHAGPLSALAHALPQAPAGLVAAVACDLPFANAAVLTRLAALAKAYGAAAAVPLVDGYPQVLHAVYDQRLSAPMQAAVAGGERSLRRFLAARQVLWVPAATLAGLDPAARFALAVNTPQELAAAEVLATSLERSHVQPEPPAE